MSFNPRQLDGARPTSSGSSLGDCATINTMARQHAWSSELAPVDVLMASDAKSNTVADIRDPVGVCRDRHDMMSVKFPLASTPLASETVALKYGPAPLCKFAFCCGSGTVHADSALPSVGAGAGVRLACTGARAESGCVVIGRKQSAAPFAVSGARRMAVSPAFFAAIPRCRSAVLLHTVGLSARLANLLHSGVN
jgi:hypothetical protein